MKRFKHRSISLILLVCLVSALFAPVSSAEGLQGRSISDLIIPDDALEINSIRELNALSELCRLDSWSIGKSVVLMCDIDVSNSDFVPVPSFSGVFYGNGHTISGLSIKGGYSPAGLFLELTEGATVRDLTVTGNIVPAGKPEYTGGIVGKNAGTVLNCMFSGTVNGYNETGGIVGCNLTSGIVSLCRIEGSVVGMNMTGGIVGRNEGTIIGCESAGKVNNVSSDPSITLDDLNLNIDMSDLSSIGRHENVPMDTGGIAGYSVSTIIGCNSMGITGYPHIGYNVGGIAGRNCGYISGCASSGSVYGRKDIGGIVGQAEPWRQEVISESDLSILQGQITAMQATVNQLQADAATAGDAVSSDLTELQTMLNGVFESMHNITTSVSVSVPDVKSLIEQYYPEGSGSSLPNIGDIGGSIGDIGSGGTPDIGDISSGIESVVGSLDTNQAETALEMMGEFASGIYASGTTDLSGVRKSISLFADSVGTINNSYTGHSFDIINDLNKLTGQVTGINDTVNKILFNPDTGTGAKINDVSLINPDLALLGKISKCTNRANIEGDYNVGGIVGTQANESGIDPEDDLSLKIDNAITKEYNLVVLTCDCKNYGTVKAKMDYCGGITGRVGLGAVYRCEGYGIISSTGGNYVGGIAGQNSSTVKGCYAKAVLSGKNYVGGITGYTTDENTDGGSGKVTNCVSMVNIIEGQRYCGAVSGVESGNIRDNVFISDRLCGYNHVSKRGEAEPATYEQILRRKGLPEEFLSMQVYFICDDMTVSTVSKEYGEELTAEDIPEIPVKNGQYGKWDIAPGAGIKCDSIAVAEYEPNVRTIGSDILRDDGRRAFYVQGVFAPDAVLEAERTAVVVSTKTLPFRINVTEYGREVLEQWKISFPDDGSGEHIIRYRTPNGSTEHISIFENTGDGWKLRETEAQGSYLLFTVENADTEIVIVSSASVAGIIILGFVFGLLLFSVNLYFMLVVRRRTARRYEAMMAAMMPPIDMLEGPQPEEPVQEVKPAKNRGRKTLATLGRIALVAVIAVVVLAICIGIVAPNLASGALGSYYISKLGRMNEREMLLSVEGYRDGSDFSLNAGITTSRLPDGGRVSCVSTQGIKLYYSNGTVFLENGKAYAVSNGAADYLDVVQTAVSVFRGAETTVKREGGYTIISASADGEGVKEILEMIFPQLAESIQGIRSVDVSMYVLNNRISYFTLSGGVHNATDSIFSLNAKLQIIYNGDGAQSVPAEVISAIEARKAGGEAPELDLTPETLSLLSAWGNFQRKDPKAAAVSLKIGSTLLSVSTDLDWFSKNVNGTDISCITVGSASYYMSGGKMCSANGGSVSIEQINNLSAVNLIDAAFTLSQGISPEVSEQNGAKIYTVRMSGDSLNDLAVKLAPQLEDYDISLSTGSMYITVRDGSIAQVSFSLSGEIDLLVGIPVTVTATASVKSNVSEADCEIPLAVVSVLAG